MNEYPYIIVLILSYNGKKLLEESISSYLRNEYSNFKVVVIDNGSADGSEEFVKENFPEVKLLVLDKNKGYSGGFNFGLKYAFEEEKADYVLVTNNDVKADNNAITELVNVAEDEENVGFVTGKVYFYDNPNFLQSVGKKHHELYWSQGHIGYNEEDIGQFDEIRQLEWCDDIYWLVNSSLYNETRGYDEDIYFQAEDFDWQIRAKRKGFKIFYTPHSKIWHKESATIGKKSPFKAYYDARNRIVVHMKHREYSEYKYFYKRKRMLIIKEIIKNAFKFRLKYTYSCMNGLTSAIFWGLKNNRITISQVFK